MRRSPHERNFNLEETQRIAAGYLAAPHSIPKARELDPSAAIIRFWHYPSFHENRSWCIYQLKKPRTLRAGSMLRQVTWDLPADGQRWEDPLVGLEQGFHVQPTIEVRDRPLDTEAFNEHMKSLGQIVFPAFAASPFGIDGETFGIEEFRRHAKVEWWCDGPETWSGLAQWAAVMREWLTAVAMAPPNPDLGKPPRPLLP